MKLPDWLFRRPAAARIAPLSTRHAERLAEIHSEAFTRPWDALEFERSLAERNVFAEGLFLGRRYEPAGFILSRKAADEAEILSVAVEKARRRCGIGPGMVSTRATSSRRGTTCATPGGARFRGYSTNSRKQQGRRQGFSISTTASAGSARTRTVMC